MPNDSNQPNPYLLAREAGAQIAERWGNHDVAVVLGSGLSDAVPKLGELVDEVPTSELPGFPPSTVAGHGGTVASVKTADKRTLLFKGRVHLYEGNSPHQVVHGIRAAAAAGCQVAILTNAAGGMNPDIPPGSPILISDHLNLTSLSPLFGPAPPPPHDTRFVDLTEAYSLRLRDLARRIDPTLHEGVYAGLPGPHYETPAEIRMLAQLGCSMVGMSTVLECIAARHLELEVLGVSLVTNMAAGMSAGPLSHTEVMETGSLAGARVGELLAQVIEQL